jgi:hypothetical protein
MADGVRYRYKGHFISQLKAQRIANLPAAKKYLSSEYTFKNKADAIRKGYQKPVAALLGEAISKSRKSAAIKRAEPERKTGKQLRAEAAKRVDRRLIESKILSYAREAAELAEEEDIDIASALDSMAGERGGYFIGDYFDSIGDSARGIIDYGEGAFDFDMEDLEGEEDRIS